MEHPEAQPRREFRWQRPLARFFGRPAVELTVGVLILVSVVTTMIELALSRSAPLQAPLSIVNDAITGLFAIELSLRLLAIMNPWRFLRYYWIDVLAVLPLLRPLRAFRALRLLRLLRMLRVIGIFSRSADYFPYVVRRGAVEYLVVFGLILLTITFGATAILTFERDPGGSPSADLDDFGEVLWFSIYSLIAGEPIPDLPRSLGGRIVTIFIMFMSLTIFAMFTGTVSAFMVDRLRTEGRVVEWDQFSDHIVMCGWSGRAEIILREYEAAHQGEDDVIVVVTDLEDEPVLADASLQRKLRFLKDDFTKVAVLEQAGIERAATCIILSDLGEGRSEQDADARTILAALTVEKLAPHVYTCAELNSRDYGSHLEMGQVNDYVVSGEHSAFLLAQAALNRGMMGLYNELITHQRGNQFYRLPLPSRWEGRTFYEAFTELKRSHNAILVAVRTDDGRMNVNPEQHTFARGDEIVVIAGELLDLENGQ